MQAKNKEVKAVRAKLIAARYAYQAVEKERNELIYRFHTEGWSTEKLSGEFGMKPANVEEAIYRVKKEL